MKILVTGGSGFIGSHLIRELIKQGHDVRSIDIKQPRYKDLEEYHRYMMIQDNVYPIIKHFKPDVVIHLAAQTDVRQSIENPRNDADTNIWGTINLLETLENCDFKGKFIFSSSAAVYGDPDTYRLPIDENAPLKPLSPYGMSKMVGEYYINLSKLDTTILRFSNVYGEGSKGVISHVITAIQENQKIEIYGGKQTRDFIYVKDIVSALIKCIEAPSKTVYNVSTNTEVSVVELVNKVMEVMGTETDTLILPKNDGEIDRSCLNNLAIAHDLKWKPEYALEDGLRDLLNT